MKLNNLSRLTALLLALTMILPTFAVAEDGTDFDQITEDYLNSVAETVVLIDTLVADGYCETCAADVAAAGLTAWPVSGYTCLYEHLDDLSASAAYDMLIAYYNANTAEGDSLWKAYITSHNNHVINAANAGSSEYPAIICDCAQPVLKPGDSNHGTSCPWADEEYVTTTTLTDTATGITVTGDIPAGVKLEVKTATKPSIDTLITMIDPSKYAEEFTVLAYDITLKQADGTAWQPTSAVTVTVPGAYSNVPANPMAEAVHMLADGGHEVLATTVNANGSVSFVATRFSTYYVVAGKENTYNQDFGTDINELNDGDEHTFYVEKGVSLIFNQGDSTTWTISGDNSYSQYFTPTTKYVTAVNAGEPTGRFTAIDVSDQAPVGASITYTLSWFYGYRRATLTFIVQTHDYIVDSAINSTTYPVILAIDADGSDGIPGEPGVNPQESWLHITSSYGIQTNRANFASSGKDIINPEIKNDIQSWTNSVDGSSTYGVYDPTGVNTKKYLEDIDWDRVLQLLVGRVTATDGEPLTTTNMNDYEAIPYVVKLMSARDIGWHIDCAVVKKSHVTLSYDLNLKGYIVTSPTLSAPGADSGAKPHTTSAAGISGITVGQEINATLLTDATETYKIKFLGWSTDPNATTVEYEVGKSIKIDENTMLYAVWEGKKIVSSLTIAKALEGEGLETNTTEFTFNVTNEEGSYNQEVKVKAGSSLQLPNLNPGNYTVTELAPPDIVNYVFKGVKIDNIETEPTNGTYSTPIVIGEGASTVTFTNVYELDVADLTITKEVVGAPAGIAEQEFAITVSLPEKAEGYTYIKTLADESTQEDTLTTNGGTLNIKNGETIVIKDVAIGSNYSVTETEPSYFTVTGEVENAQIGNEENKVSLTNAYKSGQLSITKTVQAAENVDVSKDVFTFTVTLDPAVTGSFDYTVNGSTHTATFDKGVGTIALKAGETAIFTTLPHGVQYTVKENDVQGYVLDTDNKKTYGLSGTIDKDKDEPSAAVFTNIHKFGNLVISKTVSGEDAPGGKFVFNITLNDTTINDTYGAAKFSNGVATVTLKNGETATIMGLPSGVTYTVEEVAVPGYTTEATGASGTIVDAGTQTVEFINTYSVGNLSITKNVVGNTAPSDVPFSFVVNFTPIENIPLAESYNYVITSVVDGATKQEGTVANGGSITLQNGQTATISGIQAGVGYAVTETQETGFPYTVTQTGSTGTIAANETQAAVFTNTYTKGDLKITKAVSGNGADLQKKFTFTVTIGANGTFTVVDENGNPKDDIISGGTIQLKNGETAIIKDLPAGTKCTVTETAVAGYATKVNGEEALTGEATIVAGGVENIAFTNTYSVADLTITKKVVPETNVTAPADAFTITVNLTAGANAVLADDYTVKVDNAVLEAKYTPAANKQTATLIFDLVDGQTATIVGLQVDTTYTVVETEKAYYTAAYDPSTISTRAKEIVSGTNTVTVTNSYNTGNLTVTKTVAGTYAPKGEQSETFNFTLTLKDNGSTVTPPITVNNQTVNWSDGVYVFTLKDGDSITIYGIPDGVTYTVTEVQFEGFDYTTKVNDVAGNTATGTANNDPTVTFTNTYKYSQLTITKDVSDDTPTDLAAQEFKLTVTLPNGGSYPYTVNGTAATTLLNGGENQLTIKNNQRIVIDKLPIDEAFSVTEDEPTYFNVNGEVSNVKIDDAGNTVAITNTYKPGSLTITKVVQAASGVTVPADDEFEFMVTLTGMTDKSFAANVTGLTNETTLTFSAGIASFKMKAGESVTITNLPAGVFYTVTEAAHPDYELTAKTGDTGTITEAEATANFTNTYQYSDLKISKTVVNASELYKDDLTAVPFTFTVTLGNGTSPSDLKYQIGNAAEQAFNGTITLKAGETATIKNIPVGTTYTVAETPVAGYTTKVAKNNSTPVDRTAEEGTIAVNTVDMVAFTNTYSVGRLTVTKTVVDKSGMGYDLTKDVFTFTVNFSDTVNAYTYTRSDNTTGTITGTGTITLKHGETATFDRIPAGVIYKVTEPDTMPCVGYKLTASENTTGEIGADKTSAATFENTYYTGTLTIIKTGMQGNESAIFTVNARTKDHPEGRNYTIALSNNEQVTIAGLVIDSSFSISENGNWSNRYSVASEKSGTILEDGTTVTINNTKKNYQWLHDEDSVENDFSTNGNYQ